MVYLILMGIVSLAVALFAVQNATSVDVNFMFWTFTTSQVLIILGCFVAGLFIAFCWGLKLKATNYLRGRKLREEIASLQKENTLLQEKINMQFHVEKQRVAESNASPTIKPFNPGR